MRNLFEHTSASWVKYSDYEYKEKNGTLYLLPTEDAAEALRSDEGCRGARIKSHGDRSDVFQESTGC